MTKIDKINNNSNNFDEKLNKVLVKRALGYSYKEVIEEYQQDGDDLKLIKKKVSKKIVPPDINAVKILLDKNNEDELCFDSLSDEELEKMKEELLLEINEND